MRKLHRAVALLLTLMMVLSVLPLGAAAYVGPDVAVPEGQELVYFADCGATSFTSDIEALIAQYPDSVVNKTTPDQAYDASSTTPWGYTNPTGEIETNYPDSGDIYKSVRNFQAGQNGKTLSYKFTVPAGTYQVAVGLYDPWSSSNPLTRVAEVQVNQSASQEFRYSGSNAGMLTFKNIALAEAGTIDVNVAPDDPNANEDNRDALVSFIMVTRTVEEPEPEQPALPDYVYGPGGVNWKLDVTYVCSNDSATHKGGKTEHNNFLSSGYFSFGEMEYVDGTWEMNATVNAAKLLEEYFGVAHTATENPVLRLEYLENGKWAIKSDSSDVYELTLEGSCANTLATPTLEDLPIWVQLYKGEYQPLAGMLLDKHPDRFRNSVEIGTPYEKDGTWYCDVTVTGYTDNVEQMDYCAVNYILNSGHYPYVCLDEYSKTITMTYNPNNSTWQAPELPKTTTHRGENDSTSQTHNGVAFLVGEQQPDAPAMPNQENAFFHVTVYSEEAQLDGSPVKNREISSSWWGGYPDLVDVDFTEPVQGSGGVWTCQATINAEAYVAKTIEDSTNTPYRRSDDPTTKTITLTYDDNAEEWIVPSDGVDYADGGSKNGVAFKLVKQFKVTFAPGRDLSFGIPSGEEYSGGVHDAGALVELPETADFVPSEGEFAGWCTTIKYSYLDSRRFFYPIGTDMEEMFATDVTLEAYWMDVELEVASEAYDATKAVTAYTFGNTATFQDSKDSVTVLYRAKVLGNSRYPYALSCNGATAVYSSALSGSIDMYNTYKYVYFTKTYTSSDGEISSETVTMGNASDNAAVSITWKEEHEHTYGEPEWDWAADYSSATATFTCSSCDDVHTETATATSSTTAPTCTEAGETIYSATVTFNGTEYTGTKTVTLPATGHKYGAPQWTWAADNTASAKFTCSACDDVQTVTATVTSTTTEPTCTTDGQTIYTATVTFSGENHTDTKTVTITATGHKYGAPVWAWAADNSTATAKFTCSACGDVQNANATVTSTTTVPTCTTDGQTVYTATVTFGGEDHTDTKTVTIPANGHKYGAPVWAWAADNSTATAKFTCSACDDVQTVNATATPTTTEPTCTADGKTVYSATVTFNHTEYTGTKTVTLPATGHDYGAPQWVWHKDHTAYAIFTCAHDKTHQETCKASVTRSVQKATCTRPETTTYTATVLFNGTRYQDKLVVEGYALGHRWNDGEVTTRPTASKPGERTYTCLRCGAVKYETIPATGETVVDYFWDVSAHDWFADEVTYVVEAGLMEGVGNHLFDPNGEVTRAMTWTVLARMDGEDVDGGTPWYAKARTWAMDDGVSDGTNPNNAVTREQLVTMLYRYAGSPRVYGTLTGYTDCDKVSDWAVDAMIWATDTGLIQGMGGKLNPQGTATRAQLATMLMRFVEIMK